MDRAKTLIIAGIGAMAALTIYGAASTKSASADKGHKNRLARIEALMDEGGVQYRSAFFRHKSTRKSAEKIAGLEPAKTVTEVAPTAPKVDAKAEAAKKAAEKKAADEKKKKEEAAKKKKKKKKKKKSDSTQEASPTQDEAAADETEPKKEDDANAGGLNGGLSAMPYAGFSQQDPNKVPETIDEWIAYLFANPTFEKTSKFIQLAQVGTVKQDVFFAVVEKMLGAEGRLPEFGVMALGSVPTSQSFELLAAVANEPTLDEKIKIQSQQYMNTYTRIEYVRFLGPVTLSKDPLAASDAIQLITRSLTNLRNLGASQPGATSTARLPASSITKMYEQIQASLNEASQSSPDGSVRTAAGQVAQQLASLLQTVEAQLVASAVGP
jgi:hypothetical protein